MRRVPFRATAAALLALCAAGGRVPVAARGGSSEEGAIAPAGCWTVEDGAPARTGAAETTALRGPLTTAWTWTPTGTIEGELRVWKERVLVVDRVAPARAFLRVLRLSDGKETSSRALDGADVAVEPAVWEDAVVVRTSRNRLEGLSLADGLEPRWRREGADFGPPLLVGHDEVYVREGAALERLTYGKDGVVWSVPVRPDGGLALRGNGLYVTQASADGAVDLVEVGRSGGRVLRRVAVGRPTTAPTPEDVHVRVGLEVVVVEHGADLAGAPRGVASAWVDRAAFSADSQATAALAGPPALAPHGGIGLLVDPADGVRLVRDLRVGRRGALDQDVLATRTSHPELVQSAVAPTIAGGVVHIGASAFDGEEVLRFDERSFRKRSIPATGRLLLVQPSGRLLTALEEQDGESRRPWEFLPPAYVLPVDAAVVRENGAVTRGAFRFDPMSRTLVPQPPGTGTAPVPLADVTAIVASNGRLLAARDVARAVKGLVAYGRAQPATDGASAITPRSPADAVWAATAALPSTTRPRTRCEFVRATLDLDPLHADAVAWVRSALPPGTHLTRAFDPREWIDFVEAATETRVRLVDVPEGRDPRGLDGGRRALAEARRSWRPDLVALETTGLFLLTPLAKPARLAPFLSTGDLVCDTLERIFAVGRAKRDRTQPLVHHLYESKAEYLAQSTKGDAGKGREAAVRWLDSTAGYYDGGDHVSRLYLAESSADLASTLSVYTHELTHHWIDVRCPLFADADRRAPEGMPGYWVVEGFAVMVQEFRFDLAARTATTLDPQAASLEVVAGADPASLIAWDRLLGAPGLDGFPVTQTVPVPLRRRLGARVNHSPRDLFYAQAGALCHWAFETGRRPALLQMVADHYTGAVKPGYVKALFGMEPKAVGAAVQAWAREVTRR